MSVICIGELLFTIEQEKKTCNLRTSQTLLNNIFTNQIKNIVSVHAKKKSCSMRNINFYQTKLTTVPWSCQFEFLKRISIKVIIEMDKIEFNSITEVVK